ncbi:hypothetical protein QN277_006482 [Acacia crassicarpa]|nr:hypothetical protein QN277_006482 [Acacia crassicarpa]
MNSVAPQFLMFIFVVFTSIKVYVADCDNLQDTCIAASSEEQSIFINGLPCKNPAEIIAPHNFKNMDFGKAGSTDNNVLSSMKIISASEFPGLNTLGLSIGRTDIDVDGVVQTHRHPRATEMIFVVEGVIVAGFIDTENKKFEMLLNVGDVFIFPKGLYHFCGNRGRGSAILLSVYNSQNPGMVSATAAKSRDDFADFTWTESDSFFIY